jgi:transposase
VISAVLVLFGQMPTSWLREYRLPAYAPDPNLVEDIWSLMKRFMANFAAVGHGRIIKRKLKKI